MNEFVTVCVRHGRWFRPW